jgi:hypothetical protein
MFWIVLSIIIIAGLIIYSKQKGKVTLTKEQAELALKLVKKELHEIESEKQHIIDDAASQGKTISLNSIFEKFENEPEPLKSEYIEMKKYLFEKYGPNLPVDVVYRIAKEKEFDQKE